MRVLFLTIVFFSSLTLGQESPESFYTFWKHSVGRRIARGTSIQNVKKKNLAAALGLTRFQISKIISGEQSLTLELGYRIAANLNASPEYILGIDLIRESFWENGFHLHQFNKERYSSFHKILVHSHFDIDDRVADTWPANCAYRLGRN